MKIFQDYDIIKFQDVTFYGTIRRLDKDEIEEGCQPKIKIWHSQDPDNNNWAGEVVEIRKVNNDFKATFNNRYSHSHSILKELNKVIDWVIEEVMKHPHYMTGRMNIPPTRLVCNNGLVSPE